MVILLPSLSPTSVLDLGLILVNRIKSKFWSWFKTKKSLQFVCSFFVFCLTLSAAFHSYCTALPYRAKLLEIVNARYGYFKDSGIAGPKKHLTKAITVVNSGALDGCFGKSKAGFNSPEVLCKFFFIFLY
jgi:hypothetical protein